MKINTASFGEIEFVEDALIHFKEGIIGFPAFKRFVLLENPEVEPFKWLQPIEEPRISFLVISPQVVFPDYRVELPQEEKEDLGFEAQEGPLTLTITIIHPKAASASTNLLAPLVINPRNMRGKQVVLSGSGYSVEQALILQPAEEAEIV